MTLMAVATFARFFREAAGLSIDKQDQKRFDEFVPHKIHDLLVRAEAVARANGRDVIEPWDLPITKGLQESINAFVKLDQTFELSAILEHLAGMPQLGLGYSTETRDRLPVVAGGIALAVARSIAVIDPTATHPRSADFERAFHLFDLLL